jgi:hypothetical protein
MKLIRPGDDLRGSLDLLEQQICDLKNEIDQTQDACVPLEETRARLRMRIEGRMDRIGGNPFGNFQSGERTFGYAMLPDVFQFEHYVWLVGIEQVLDQIMAKFESAGQKTGLPVAERAARIAELQALLRAAEGAAEIAALDLEAAGFMVLRRADADVSTILQVWKNMPATAPEKASAVTKA